MIPHKITAENFIHNILLIRQNTTKQLKNIMVYHYIIR